jgi:acyl-activating enzyme 14
MEDRDSWLFVLIVLLSTGTTGKPKGVTLSHSALIIQSLSKIAIVGYGEDDVRLSSWYTHVLFSLKNISSLCCCSNEDIKVRTKGFQIKVSHISGVKPFVQQKQLKEEWLLNVSCVGILQVYLHTAPLCHIGGLSSAVAMLMVGGCHVLIPKFEPKSALEAIERHKVTSLITVPAIMADIISLIRYTILFCWLKNQANYTFQSIWNKYLMSFLIWGVFIQWDT